MIFYLSFLNKITMKIVANNIKCVTVATDRFFFSIFFLVVFVCANVHVIQFCIRSV